MTAVRAGWVERMRAWGMGAAAAATLLPLKEVREDPGITVSEQAVEQAVETTHREVPVVATVAAQAVPASLGREAEAVVGSEGTAPLDQAQQEAPVDRHLLTLGAGAEAVVAVPLERLAAQVGLVRSSSIRWRDGTQQGR